MRRSSLPSRGFLLILLCFVGGLCHTGAQEKAPPADGVLESAPAKIARLERDLTEKIDAVRTVLDKEVAEKRITEPAAQPLRWSLRTAAIAFSGTDIRSVIATARVPFENQAVANACKELEATFLKIQAEYADFQKAALADARKRAMEMIKTAQQAEQITTLIEQIEGAQTVLLRRFAGVPGGDPNNTLAGILFALGNLRRLVEAEATGNLRVLSMALGAQTTFGTDSQGIQAEMKLRLVRARAPYLEKVEKTQADLDAALEARISSDELPKKLSAYSEAVEQASELRISGESIYIRDIQGTLTTYRSLFSILAAMEARDFASALQQMRNLRSSSSPPPKIIALLRTWEEQAHAQQARFFKERIESWRARIGNIKGPDDLGQLAGEVSQTERMAANQERRAEDEPFPFGLGENLISLAAAWRTANPMLVREDRARELAGARSDVFGIAVTALRRRIERDVIGRVLKDPELSQPPLAEMEPQAAFEALGDQLAAKKEWRRLLELRQAWLSPGPEFYGRGDELTSALRAYLAGENFELAEQWTDAASAYKQVLLCTAKRAPVADAAERLKAIKKEHPEAAAAPLQKASSPRRSQEEE
jgi:hypothetical protein